MITEIPLLNTSLKFFKKDVVLNTIIPFSIYKLQEIISYTSLVDFHLLGFNGIWVQKSGISEHKLQGQNYLLREKNILLLKENLAHQLLTNYDANGYLLAYHPSFYDTFKKGLSMNDFFFFNESLDTDALLKLDLNQHNNLLSIVEAIYTEFKHVNNAEIIWAYTHILLLSLERLQKNVEGHLNNHSKEITHQFELLIHKWYKKHLPISAYADALHISPNYLNQLCKKNFGKNAKRLVDDRLLTEAKRALFSGNLSISEIAFTLNFKDASYFSRFFKKQTGKTPETYKNKHILE